MIKYVRCISFDYNTVSKVDPCDPCVFPYSYEGVTYTGCTTADNNGIARCATSHHAYSIRVKDWSNCSSGCHIHGIS